MSDDEGRRDEARIEAAIERGLRNGLRNGTMGHCWYCKDITNHKDIFARWLCSYCERMMENPGD